MSPSEAKLQFENEIKADLNRWFEESDLDVDFLAGQQLKLWKIGWTRIPWGLRLTRVSLQARRLCNSIHSSSYHSHPKKS
jgi:hypothetical protein